MLSLMSCLSSSEAALSKVREVGWRSSLKRARSELNFYRKRFRSRRDCLAVKKSP
jgi:hypothetical protein